MADRSGCRWASTSEFVVLIFYSLRRPTGVWTIRKWAQSGRGRWSSSVAGASPTQFARLLADDHPLDVTWVTALGGHEIYRINFVTTGTRPVPDYTPEPELLRAAIALVTPLEVLSDAPWHLTHRVADRYRVGCILFAGIRHIRCPRRVGSG